MATFLLPDVGEGLTEAEIVTWRVAPGDVVKINDTLVEIETAKSVVELPSPHAGTIEALHAEAGSTIEVHSPLVTIRTTEDAPAEDATPVIEPAETPDAKPLVLVGTGPTAAAKRTVHLAPRASRSGRSREGFPPARFRARRLEAMAVPTPPADETRIPIKGVRKATAIAVTASAFTAPHVTEWLSIDMTATMDVVAELKRDRDWQDTRVTPLLMVARALVLAARKYPAINASWDDSAQEIVIKHRVNLGIAAATPRGLMVPNIKGADALDLRGLASALADLVATAKSGASAPADLSGGTITITNIGGLGVDGGTPILNRGEAAILAFGQVRPTPWVVDGVVAVRQVAQLALSFDHRMIDGELGSNVLAEVGRILSSPWRAALA